jgi:hypothetical protein
MKPLSEEIRSTAISAGADRVGFAPVERFNAGPEKTQPAYYMPKARSVPGPSSGLRTGRDAATYPGRIGK